MQAPHETIDKRFVFRENRVSTVGARLFTGLTTRFTVIGEFNVNTPHRGHFTLLCI